MINVPGGTKKSPCVTPELSAYLPTTEFLLLSPNRIVAVEPGGSMGKCSASLASRVLTVKDSRAVYIVSDS